jgi:hypothetical protein
VNLPAACAFALLATAVPAPAQNASFPQTIEAGTAFSAEFGGNGQGTLYIVGPNQVLKKAIQLGQMIRFAAGTLYNAGHYSFLVDAGSQSQNGEFDVVPANAVSEVSFLAKPSRLPVGLHGGITGAIYVFDSYGNLMTSSLPVYFELSNPSGGKQVRSMMTRDGSASTAMDSTPQQGVDKFLVKVGNVSSTRIIRQVPGDPCRLVMKAKSLGQKVQLVTDPVRDCNGNQVPDGTIVTFTEAYNGEQSTADVPVKQGVAEIEMPARAGATISIASGVALGNQIRWE